MAEIRNEYGGCSIERCINFERREGYMENMRVEQFEKYMKKGGEK